MYQAPGRCPTCESQLEIRELGCATCGTRVQGQWEGTPLQRLSGDQQAFLILFVRSRGNLSEVERALGVSYPTVRAKLEDLINALADVSTEGAQVADAATSSSRREILERVSRGEIRANEALDLLRRTSGSDEEHE
jgi:hypothetical protein